MIIHSFFNCCCFVLKLSSGEIMIRIDNIKIYDDLTEDELFNKVYNKYKINVNDVMESKIIKKSIDARDKDNVHYNYIIDIKVLDESKYLKFKHVDEVIEEEIVKRRKSDYNPIIVGSGPAGLFCALTLVDNGYKPIIIEQGCEVSERISIINDLKENRNMNVRCNVQFGEGGAGTFSDGKLTTGVNSPYINKVLNYFYQFGAPKEILYLSKPHIGTDNLQVILQNMRKYIESKGGKYYFKTKMTNIVTKDNLINVICEDKEFVTDALVLAIGHSARDTYKMLYENNFVMQRKNFAIGLRIEHKQSMINEAQYGTKTKLSLPPADYKLVYHNGERSCFTFCMCPGGEVVASNSEENSIVTNGMSTFKRDLDNANSALLVNILTTDLEGSSPLEGMYFQEKLEREAYKLGGSNYNAPVQRVEDFINNVASMRMGSIIPSYKPGYKLSNLNEILPPYVSKTIKEGILYFDKKIKGFANSDAILTGVETRSSAPLTILRDENLESSVKGIYPCGEGAGYAGGITTSAIDGIRVAISIIENGK